MKIMKINGKRPVCSTGKFQYGRGGELIEGGELFFGWSRGWGVNRGWGAIEGGE